MPPWKRFRLELGPGKWIRGDVFEADVTAASASEARETMAQFIERDGGRDEVRDAYLDPKQSSCRMTVTALPTPPYVGGYRRQWVD
jgi:hypothetical protein